MIGTVCMRDIGKSMLSARVVDNDEDDKEKSHGNIDFLIVR